MKETPSDLRSFLREGESLVLADRNKSSFRDVKQKWFVPQKNEPDLKPEPKVKSEHEPLADAENPATASEVQIEKEVQSISLHPEKSTKPKFDQVCVLNNTMRI